MPATTKKQAWTKLTPKCLKTKALTRNLPVHACRKNSKSSQNSKSVEKRYHNFTQKRDQLDWKLWGITILSVATKPWQISFSKYCSIIQKKSWRSTNLAFAGKSQQ